MKMRRPHVINCLYRNHLLCYCSAIYDLLNNQRACKVLFLEKGFCLTKKERNLSLINGFI